MAFPVSARPYDFTLEPAQAALVVIDMQRAFIEPRDPIHQWRTVQAACDPGIVAPSDLPTHPLRQLLRDLVVRLPPSPPSSLVCLPALEDSGPLIKVLAYVGTSVRFPCQLAFSKKPKSHRL